MVLWRGGREGTGGERGGGVGVLPLAYPQVLMIAPDALASMSWSTLLFKQSPTRPLKNRRKVNIRKAQQTHAPRYCTRANSDGREMHDRRMASLIGPLVQA